MKVKSSCVSVVSFVFALWLVFGLALHAGQYFQDFTASPQGATNFTDGSQLFSTQFGATRVVDGNLKELALTASGTNDTRAAFMLPDLDPGAPVYAFSAKWNAEINGAFTNAADGFSFNFGQLAGLDLVNASYAQESGYPTGITFSVQTYWDKSPGFYLRVNGATVASLPYNSATRWGVNSQARHFFEVDWNYTNGVTVRVDGQIIFANVATPGLSIQAGHRFVWAARTGGLTEELRLDNIVIMSGGNLVPVPMTNPYYKSGEYTNNNQTADKAFDNSIATKWLVESNRGYVGASCAAGPRAVRVYSLTSAEDIPGRDPKNWTLDGSNNGTSWSSIASGSGYFTNRNETRAWLASNAPPFGAFRLNISTNHGGAEIQLAELRLYEFVPVVRYQWSPVYNVGFPALAAASGDSTRIVALSDGNFIYTSTNSGATWTQTGPSGRWKSVAASADGKKFIAGSYENGTWVSTDSGASWHQTPLSTSSIWPAVHSSLDGTRLLAGALGGEIWKSADSGASWVPAGPISQFGYSWSGVTASSDNSKIAGVYGGPGLIFTSANGGGSWTPHNPPDFNRWMGIASSADGTRLVAVAAYPSSGGVFTSGNSGATWTKTLDGSYSAVACTPDGSKWIIGGSAIYLSCDYGMTWAQVHSPALSWETLSLSTNGTRIVGAGSSSVWVSGFATPTGPLASTLPADAIKFSGARLNGQAVPRYALVTTFFQWGLTTNYGSMTAPSLVDGDTNAVTFNAALGGLAQNTTYHYRAVVSNAFGTAYGPDFTFTTLNTNSPVLSVVFPGDAIAASSTNSPDAQGAANVIDGSVATKYLNFDQTNAGFIVYPAATNVPVRALTLISADDAPERDPASFLLEGSPDGTNFTQIASNAVPPFAGRRAIQTFNLNNATVYRVYRVTFPTIVDPANANSVQIAEVELLAHPEISLNGAALNITAPGGATVSRTGLIDRSLADSSKLEVDNVTNANTVVDIAPGTLTQARGLEWIGSSDDALFPGRTPSFITLAGFDGSNYVTLQNITNSAPTANLQIHPSAFANTNLFQSYRVTFGPPQSGNILQVGEVRLFGETILPSLSVRAAGANVLVSWPASGFSLETKTNLAQPDWVVVTNAPVLSNGVNTVTLPMNGAPTGFFRLRK
jgi:hypothetical protein